MLALALALVLGSQALGAPFAEWLEHRLADGRLVHRVRIRRGGRPVFKAVKSIQCADDGSLSIGEVDASKDRQFYRLVVGPGQVAEDTVLSD